MLNLTMVEIFCKLDDIAKPLGIDLSFQTRQFYYNILCFCDENGLYDEEMKAFYFDLSIASLRKKFRTSTHIIQTAFASLTACGLILRTDYKPSFGKISSGGYTKNKPIRTYIYLEILNM